MASCPLQLEHARHRTGHTLQRYAGVPCPLLAMCSAILLPCSLLVPHNPPAHNIRHTFAIEPLGRCQEACYQQLQALRDADVGACDDGICNRGHFPLRSAPASVRVA
eukprot:948346-Prymnesium_polylepis.2